MYPNEEKMIVVPITKRMEINMSIQICHISWVNFDHKENDGRKAFLATPKHQFHIFDCGVHDCSADN